MDYPDRPIKPEDIPKTVLVGKPLLVFTSSFVSICVFLFGYDQGYFSSILTNDYFEDYFDNPSAVQIGTVVGVLEIGALLSSLTLGHVADRLGRRATTRLGAFLFCIGGAIQACAQGFHELGIGRFISGLGVGYLSGMAPTYMTEIASPDTRGLLGCAQFTGNVLGYASSIWIDYGCSFIENNWSFRIPLALQVVFGLILFFGSFVLVESPRWLLEHDKDAEGLVVLADLFADGEVHSDVAVEEYKNIKESVLMGRLEGKLNYIEAIRRYPKRVFVGCSAQMFAQFNGINVISYYAPLVFEEAGWVGREAILMTGYNSIVYLLSTLIPWRLSETWGRKPLLTLGGTFMGIALILVALFTDLKYSYPVVFWVVFYQSSFGASWGPIGWLIGPEVLPNKARASGAALATATNWLCNYIVGQLAPILLEKISWRLYLIHAVCCFISAVVVWKVYPETKGLSLEEMDSVFDDQSSMAPSVSDQSFAYEPSIASSSSTMTGTPAQQARSMPYSNPELSPMLGPRTTLGQQVLPAQQGQQQGFNPADIEPPDLESIYRYKTDDSHSIRGSIKKASSVFRFGGGGGSD